LRRLLLEELLHRVTNTLATVIAITPQSLRTVENLKEGRQLFLWVLCAALTEAVDDKDKCDNYDRETNRGFDLVFSTVLPKVCERHRLWLCPVQEDSCGNNGRQQQRCHCISSSGHISETLLRRS
jgi:hypothetical protein